MSIKNLWKNVKMELKNIQDLSEEYIYNKYLFKYIL